MLTNRLIELTQLQVRITSLASSLLPLLLGYNLLLELQLLLHLVDVSELLYQLLVLDLVPIVPFGCLATLTWAASRLAHLGSHLVVFKEKILLILEQSSFLPLCIDSCKYATETESPSFMVKESSDCSLYFNCCQVLRCHRSAPRLLNDPSLSDSVFPLEIRRCPLSLISPMYSWRFSYH